MKKLVLVLAVVLVLAGSVNMAAAFEVRPGDFVLFGYDGYDFLIMVERRDKVDNWSIINEYGLDYLRKYDEASAGDLEIAKRAYPLRTRNLSIDSLIYATIK